MNSLSNKKAIDLIKTERGLTIDLAIAGTNIQKMERVFGAQNTLKALMGAIILTNDYFNLGQMSESQAMQTASILIESYQAETLQDFILCFKMAKTGEFGTVFNRIDGQVINEWFKKYLERKYERFEQIKHQEKVSHNTQMNESFLLIAEMVLKAADKSKEIEKEQEQEIRQKRITAEKHFETFKVYIKSLSKNELEEVEKQFIKENSRMLFHNFDNYIALIKKQKLEMQ